MKGKSLLVLSLTFLGALSCTEENIPKPFVYSKVFTGDISKTWKVKFLEVTTKGQVDDTFTLPCDADHQYTFYANAERAFKVTAGANKCSDTDADVINDAWGFNNATATLSMVLPFFTSSSLPFIVREAKKNKMELEIFLDEANTSSYRIHFEPTQED